MLGFSPLTAGPLAALPASTSAGGTADAYETAPLGGVVLGTDGSTFVEGTAGSGVITAEASGSLAVTATASAGIIRPAAATAATAVTATASAVIAPSDTLSVNAQIAVSGIAVTAPDIDAEFSVTVTASSSVIKTTQPNSANLAVTTSVTLSRVISGSSHLPRLLSYYCTNHSGMGATTVQSPYNQNTVTFAVTVQNVGGANKYFLDGVQQASVSLAPNAIYTFDQSHSSNAGHPLRLSEIPDGIHSSTTSEFTKSVTVVGTAGQSGANTRIVISYFYGVAGTVSKHPIVLSVTATATASIVRVASVDPTTVKITTTAPPATLIAAGTASASTAITQVAVATRILSILPDSASCTLSGVGTILNVVEVKSFAPDDASISTTATVLSIRARLVDADASIATNVPAPTTLLRIRGFIVDADLITTVSPVANSAIKGMAATSSVSVSSSAPSLAVIKSVVGSATLAAVTVSPVESTRLRLVSADVTGAATASATGAAIQFVPMVAAATVSMTATASAARAALMSATASAVLSGTATPRAIFSGAFQAAITAGHFAIIFTPKLTPRTDAIVERYSRRVLPTGELRDVLGNEFQNIERTVASVTEATILVSDAEPETKRRGMVRYAVTPWDPLANGTTGLVVYNGNSWSAV